MRGKKKTPSYMSRARIANALRQTTIHLASHVDDIAAARREDTPHYLRNISERLKWYADDLETVIDLERLGGSE